MTLVLTRYVWKDGLPVVVYDTSDIEWKDGLPYPYMEMPAEAPSVVIVENPEICISIESYDNEITIKSEDVDSETYIIPLYYE